MLHVLFGDSLVGRLWSESRVLCFQYAPEWLEGSAAFALCPALPLQAEPFLSDAPSLFFANLLPEGAVLAAILKLKRLPEGDLYAQFTAMGEDAAGAFSIVPEEGRARRNPAYRAYPLEEMRGDIATLAENMPLLAKHGELRLSLAGAQNKIPVWHEEGEFRLPVQGAASTHILKPAVTPEREFPRSVFNEALCLRLAAACGLETVDAEIVMLPEPVLVVRRYDRIAGAKRVERLHQLDFCQLAGRLPDQKYEKDGGPAFSDVFELVGRYSGERARDRLRLVDWLLFNYLIANADAHAKNLALVRASDGRLRLAPFYDLLCTAVYPSLDTRMAMSIGGEFRPEWVRRENWRRLAEVAGLNMTIFAKRAARLGASVAGNLSTACAALGGDAGDPFVGKVRGVVEDRRRKLALNLVERGE